MQPIGRLPSSEPCSLAMSPDGTLLAAGYADGSATLWDVGTRRALSSTAATGDADDSAETQVAFSHDGRLLAAASLNNGSVTLFKTSANPAPWMRFEAFESTRDDFVTGLAFFKEPKTGHTALATVGGFDNHSKLTQMRLWTVHEKPKRNSDKHLYPSGKMAHFFGRVAASSSDCVLSAATNLRESDCARTAFVRAAPAMRGRRVEVGSLSRYCGIVFSPVEARLAALSSNELALVDAHFRVLSSMPPAKEAAFSADGTRLLAQACHGVRVWDVHSGAALSSLCTGSGKEDLTCMAASLHSVVAVGRTTKNVGIELYDIL